MSSSQTNMTEEAGLRQFVKVEDWERRSRSEGRHLGIIGFLVDWIQLQLIQNLEIGAPVTLKRSEWNDHRVIIVDQRVKVLEIPGLSVPTANQHQEVMVELTVDYQVFDPQQVAFGAVDPLLVFYNKVRDIVQQYLSQRTIDSLREEDLADYIRALEKVPEAGIAVLATKVQIVLDEELHDTQERIRKANVDAEAMKIEMESEASVKEMRTVISQDKEVSDLVEFSAYFPYESLAKKQCVMVIYAHLSGMFTDVEEDVRQFIDQLGGKIQKPKSSRTKAQLALKTPITIIPECNELEFDPVSITKRWNGNWIRFAFEFIPPNSYVDSILSIRVSVQIDGVEIAHIECPIKIIVAKPKEASVKEPITVQNPLAKAKLARESATIYNRIFISYSRQDEAVVEAYRLAQLALGNDVFIDTYSIRAGEDWQSALAMAIDEADIFQLFWSSNSATSSSVRDEWDYALKFKCPETKCIGFIRPVFWSKPLPVEPPEELSHLNFRYVPLGRHKKTKHTS